MVYKKKGFPDADELVVCTIKEVTPHSVIVDLDGYDVKEGIVHAAELSRKTARNIKTLLKVGGKKVCKVMGIDKEKNIVDLSLRRVGAGQERSKLAQWKNEKTANDVLEVFSKDQKIKIEELHKKCCDKIYSQHKEIYPIFVDVSLNGEKVLTDLGVPAEIAKPLTELIQKRIVTPKTEITGKIMLTSNLPNGLEIIKQAIKKIQELAKKEKMDFDIKYLGAPNYKFYLISEDQKAIERFLPKLTADMEKFMQKNDGRFELTRDPKD